MSAEILLKTYAPLKQIVPSSLCLTCDVCCRFPEETSFLAPFFTGEEIALLELSGKRFFTTPTKGSKIRLERHGDGCICPYFDPKTQYCKIYGERPLDCRIYPFALMRDQDGKAVLGIDTKCPFIQEHAQDPIMRSDALEMATFIESPPILEILVTHLALIGPFQDDVIIVHSLERLNNALGLAAETHSK